MLRLFVNICGTNVRASLDVLSSEEGVMYEQVLHALQELFASVVL